MTFNVVVVMLTAILFRLLAILSLNSCITLGRDNTKTSFTRIPICINTTNLRWRFDGIGAISGGGATSKLLISYPAKERDEILDLLFKPGYLGSLQILKVEIGGDSQSTDGTEASHMHSKDDLNFNRGYEWWLMKEAKKRNPNLILYGLPWVFPGWIGEGSMSPYAHNCSNIVKYILEWIRGANEVHGLLIDYIGIWNERPWNNDYIKLLRNTLDSYGFTGTQIVAADGGLNGIENDVVRDNALAEAVDVLGYHYPGARTTDNAVKSKKRLWCSEEYSALNNLAGGGCWARILTESFVDAGYTAVIAWNLITAYYDGLPYTRSSLMTANQPWSGWFKVSSPLWITAHFTQFIDVGWMYLPVGSGSGRLSEGGSYISLVSPTKDELTIVIQTMDPHVAGCFYHMPVFNVSKSQKIEISLPLQFAERKSLYFWMSWFDFVGNNTFLFVKQKDLPITDGVIKLEITSNTVVTLTTINYSRKIPIPSPSPPTDFPSYYSDDFEMYNISEEPHLITAQAGTLEVQQVSTRKGHILMQMVIQPPIDTCLPTRMPRPIALVGSVKWENVALTIDVSIPNWQNSSSGLFIGTRLNNGGCDAQKANGLFLWLLMDKQQIVLTSKSDMTSILANLTFPLSKDVWYSLSLTTYKSNETSFVESTINGRSIIKTALPNDISAAGWVALGAANFGVTLFDDIAIKVV